MSGVYRLYKFFSPKKCASAVGFLAFQLKRTDASPLRTLSCARTRYYFMKRRTAFHGKAVSKERKKERRANMLTRGFVHATMFSMICLLFSTYHVSRFVHVMFFGGAEPCHVMLLPSFSSRPAFYCFCKSGPRVRVSGSGAVLIGSAVMIFFIENSPASHTGARIQWKYRLSDMDHFLFRNLESQQYLGEAI